LNYVNEIRNAINSVTETLGKQIDDSKINIVDCGLPHLPTPLAPGTMGVYAFLYGDRFLKIGKAGPNSNARFQSHHYNPHSSQSNLAKSILRDMEMAQFGLTENGIGSWIKANCRRIDILLDQSLGYFALELVEAMLHFIYEPKYEGFNSQRN